MVSCVRITLKASQLRQCKTTTLYRSNSSRSWNVARPQSDAALHTVPVKKLIALRLIRRASEETRRAGRISHLDRGTGRVRCVVGGWGSMSMLGC